MKDICYDCKNLVVSTYEHYPDKKLREVWKCSFGCDLAYGFVKCSHFKPKPKDTIKGTKKAGESVSKKAKSLADADTMRRKRAGKGN